jgi:MSHA biogenesis protein MshF
MPSVAKVTPRFALWLLLVLLLLMSQLQLWQELEPEAEQAAFAVVSKRMLERANLYKEYWLLNGYPSQAVLEGRKVRFSDAGWVQAPEVDKAGCVEWFSQLHPDQLVFNQNYQKVELFELSFGYQCRYLFDKGRHIDLRLEHNRLSVDFAAGKPEQR